MGSETGLAAGTRIATTRGPVAVEGLCPGDRLLTRDHGYRPLRALAGTLLAHPVEIATGRLGFGCPDRPLRLGPEHGVLLRAPGLAARFGTAELLARAADLSPPRPPGPVLGFLPFLDNPALILADGLWLAAPAIAATNPARPLRPIPDLDTLAILLAAPFDAAA
ncbi:Hint domain-containing protein [Defluviimonas sp. D31]|uniref:Hint domain-containing protein n=1 Tax=Defluviimonas sp. D31 TaxID=3083253 RepID=UPI00296E79ED|nr:Hint domain-containing protein [Defluviimonas sp. D31]MDW4549408.1 Hint domain-containing protein [Defluviimonas sp. D31]